MSLTMVKDHHQLPMILIMRCHLCSKMCAQFVLNMRQIRGRWSSRQRGIDQYIYSIDLDLFHRWLVKTVNNFVVTAAARSKIEETAICLSCLSPVHAVSGMGARTCNSYPTYLCYSCVWTYVFVFNSIYLFHV